MRISDCFMCMEHLLVTQIIGIGTIMKGWIFKMVYEKVSPELNFVDREKQVEKFWKENDIFEKSIENRKEGETYTFYDGPPTANGKPHIGHVLTRVIKDMIPRYRTMKGRSPRLPLRQRLEGISDHRPDLRRQTPRRSETERKAA